MNGAPLFQARHVPTGLWLPEAGPCLPSSEHLTVWLPWVPTNPQDAMAFPSCGCKLIPLTAGCCLSLGRFPILTPRSLSMAPTSPFLAHLSFFTTLTCHFNTCVQMILNLILPHHLNTFQICHRLLASPVPDDFLKMDDE